MPSALKYSEMLVSSTSCSKDATGKENLDEDKVSPLIVASFKIKVLVSVEGPWRIAPAKGPPKLSGGM